MWDGARERRLGRKKEMREGVREGGGGGGDGGGRRGRG